MGSMISELSTIMEAVGSGDTWNMKQAFRLQGFWLFGLIATSAGAAFFYLIYRVPFIERHLEKTFMVYSYLIIAAIIFVEVIRRFVFKEQVPWSTTVPGYLFLIMTWMGCAYNVRKRTHLAFQEFRMNMPRAGQMACLTLDFVLWFVFSWVVVVTATRVMVNSAANFAILPGTSDVIIKWGFINISTPVMVWWFLATVPLTFMLLAGRALQNFLDDISNYRNGKPLVGTAVIGGE